MNRRTFLTTQAAALTTLSVAGCTGGGGGGDGGSTPTATPTPTETQNGDGDGGSDGSSGGGSSGDEDETFEALNFKWVPDLMEITAGTTVTWLNSDVPAHSVVNASFSDEAADWDFDSGELQRGDTAEHTFEESGVYHFKCGVHGESTGCGAVLVDLTTLPGGGLPCTKLDY